MASRARLRSRSDYEYAILWENVRAEYFSNVGDQLRAAQCRANLKELEWRLAMLPSVDQLEQSSGDPLADAGGFPLRKCLNFNKTNCQYVGGV